MQVLDFSPMKESRSTCVSLLARNGRWPPFLPKARMHSFKASKDLLISAPSILVCLFAEDVSAPRSLPARSISENLPYRGFLAVLFRKIIWNTACDRDECWFADV